MRFLLLLGSVALVAAHGMLDTITIDGTTYVLQTVSGTYLTDFIAAIQRLTLVLTSSFPAASNV